MTIVLEPREDGGLHVWSDDLPGLILSGADQEAVLSDIDIAIIALQKYRAEHTANMGEFGKVLK